MARIRSIKPELRTSITVSSWPMEVRYFFVLLWGYLDDYGRGVDDTLLIASDCFPRDRGVTPDVVDAWLEAMADSGPVCRYEVDGKSYLHCPNWLEHQRPQHPGKPRVPPCPDCEPDPFDEWRQQNPLRTIRRSRKSREDLMRVSPALSGAPERASERPPASSGAVVIQMPGQMAIDDTDTQKAAGHSDSGEPPESLMNPSGGTQETLTPEQGAGSREQGAGERERASAHEPAREQATAPIDDSGFKLNDSLRRWALQTFGPGIDLEYEYAQFIDHHRAQMTNRPNWYAAFQKWVRQSVKWASEHQQQPRRAASGYSGPFQQASAEDRANDKGF